MTSHFYKILDLIGSIFVFACSTPLTKHLGKCPANIWNFAYRKSVWCIGHISYPFNIWTSVISSIEKRYTEGISIWNVCFWHKQFILNYHTSCFNGLTIKRNMFSLIKLFTIFFPLGESSKNLQVYFLLIIAMELLLWRQIVLLWHQVTIVVSEQQL